ncbi:TPA: hypothetical protein ACM2ZL_005343, partial [Klebsiella pneumoniae]
SSQTRSGKSQVISCPKPHHNHKNHRKSNTGHYEQAYRFALNGCRKIITLPPCIPIQHREHIQHIEHN